MLSYKEDRSQRQRDLFHLLIFLHKSEEEEFMTLPEKNIVRMTVQPVVQR